MELLYGESDLTEIPDHQSNTRDIIFLLPQIKFLHSRAPKINSLDFSCSLLWCC